MTDPYNEAVMGKLPPDDRLRSGIVSQVAPLEVGIEGTPVRTPGVLGFANFSVGDVVAMLRQDQSWLVLGSNSPSGFDTITGQVAFSNTPGADTTTGAAYSNFGTGTGLTFTKRIAGSKLRIDFSSSCFTTAVTTSVQFGMDVFNSDNAYQPTMARMLINTANEHTMVVGGTLLSGIAAGIYTIQPLWLRFSGAGTLTSNTDDWLAYFVSEVN